ncbi:unnamed protein product, partial [Nesidiocoris tenuis]
MGPTEPAPNSELRSYKQAKGKPPSETMLSSSRAYILIVLNPFKTGLPSLEGQFRLRESAGPGGKLNGENKMDSSNLWKWIGA